MPAARLAALVISAATISAAVSLLHPNRAQAEPPRVVLVEIDPESPPIVIGDDPQTLLGNRGLLLVVTEPAIGDIEPKDLSDRPYYNLKLLFGNSGTWEPNPPDPTSLILLEWDSRPLVQHARFYPATETGDPAFFLIWGLDANDNSYRIHQASDADLLTLSEAGVPTEAAEVQRSATGSDAPYQLGLLALGLVVIGTLAARRFVRRR